MFFLIFTYLAISGIRCGVQALQLSCVGPLVVACGLSRSPSYGILLPRPGIEPKSPALKGGFLTTGAPGNSPDDKNFKTVIVNILSDLKDKMNSVRREP